MEEIILEKRNYLIDKRKGKKNALNRKSSY